MKKKAKPGPVPDVLKIAGDWKDAMARMLRGADTPKAKAKKKAKPKGGKR